MRTVQLRERKVNFKYFDDNGNELKNLSPDEKLVHTFNNKKTEYEEKITVIFEATAKTIKRAVEICGDKMEELKRYDLEIVVIK